MNLIELALINESVVLIVADLTLLASLKLLPCLLLNHGRVGIQVLPLQADFLELLGQASLLFTLLFLLGLDLAMHLKKAFLSSSLSLSS